MTNERMQSNQYITTAEGGTACVTSLVLNGNTAVDEVQEPVVLCLRKTDSEAESSDSDTA